MELLKRLLKLFYILIFTVDEKVKNSCTKPGTKREHYKYRLIIGIVFLPILYILLFGYISDGLTLWNFFRTVLLLILFRIIGKDFTDTIIVIFFYKSSYNLTKNEIRKLKIKKLNSYKYKMIKNIKIWLGNTKTEQQKN